MSPTRRDLLIASAGAVTAAVAGLPAAASAQPAPDSERVTITAVFATIGVTLSNGASISYHQLGSHEHGYQPGRMFFREPDPRPGDPIRELELTDQEGRLIDYQAQAGIAVVARTVASRESDPVLWPCSLDDSYRKAS